MTITWSYWIKVNIVTIMNLLTHAHYVSALINCSTKVKNHSTTQIYNIFTNKHDELSNTFQCLVHTGISDHCLIHRILNEGELSWFFYDKKCIIKKEIIVLLWNYCNGSGINISHDDLIKWKHFPPYWPFVRGIHRSPVNSRTKASDAEL